MPYLEPLEDRFLLSALTAPVVDHTQEPASVQQLGTTSTQSTATDTSTHNTAPAVTQIAPSTTQKQTVPPVVAPSTPAPVLRTVAPTPTAPPSVPAAPAAPVVSAASDPYSHDDDSPATEQAEHQVEEGLRWLVAADATCITPQMTSVDATCKYVVETPLPAPVSGAASPTGLSALWGAALGMSHEATAAALLHPQPAPATDADAVPSLPTQLKAQELPETVATEPPAEPRSVEVTHAPSLLPALAGPLAGLAPFDLEGLQKGVDAFFTHLADLASDWSATQVAARATPWLVAVTAVALEIARRRKKTNEAGRVLGMHELSGWPGSFSGDAP